MALHDLAGLLGAPERLTAMRRLGLDDPSADDALERLTRLASSAIGAPVALASFVSDDRQVFKGCVGLPEPWAAERQTPLSHSFCQHVVSSREPLIVEDAREVPLLADNLAIPDLDVIAYAGFPLFGPDGEGLGSFCAIDDRPRDWTPQELDTLRDFAALAQTELDLRAAGAAAAQTAETLVRLQAVGDVALSTLDVQTLLERAANVLGVALGGHATLELADGRRAGGAEGAGATHELEVPLSDRGRAAGRLRLRRGRSFAETDRALARMAGERLAVAIGRAQDYERESRLARDLQSALSPAELPSVDGFRLTARYRAAERQVGGDWYDAFELPGGRLGLAIGDVVGHGVRAAAAAARARHHLRGAVLAGCGPADVARRLDELAADDDELLGTTLVYVEFDPFERTARWVKAGHLPPIVRNGDGNAHAQWDGGGTPLGVGVLKDWPELRTQLQTGTRIVLYTDGLVERRTATIDVGIERACRDIAAYADPGSLCDALIAAAGGGDDTAVVVVDVL